MSEAAEQSGTQKSVQKQVREAANMVHRGTVTLDEVRPTGDVDISREKFRAAVEDRIEERYERTSTSSRTSQDETHAVDWRALFEEFGFHTPGPTGNLDVSKTKLTLAISVSKQNIAGDPMGHIRDGVESGDLVKEMVEKAEGGETVRGYRLGGDLA